MREGYTSQAKKALAYAVRTAEKCGHNYVGTEHLLIGLLNVEDGTAGMVLSEFHVDAGQLTELIDRLIAPGGNTVTESRPGYTPRVRRVLENAEAEAARFKSRAVGTEHLLIAILKESDCVATRLLFTMGINIQKLYGAILTAMGEAPLQGGASGNTNTGRGPQTRGGAQSSETPALDQYSRDLTELAREGKLDPVVGRGQEIERVIQILSRRTKNNPCLIGEPGVGKTAIAEGLAQRIALGIVPETIRDKRVVVLDLSGMVAGSKYRGEFEERIKRVVKEVTENENILLFIDELHTIIGAGGAEGALDASNILKPSLSRGEIQLIGATTLEEYRKYIEKDAALERRFQPVKVEEPTESEALDILKGLRPYYERHHGVEITDEALEAAVKMSVRYINDRFLPDKAIDLLDEACARKRMEQVGSHASFKEERKAIAEVIEKIEKELSNGDILEAKNLKAQKNKLEKSLERKMKRTQRKENEIPQLTVEDAAEVVSLWTQIPVTQLTKGDMERLRNLEKELHKYVIGQDEAVKAVAKAVKRSRVGLKSPNRPIGSFLFLGPTGVGKTELSKTLARALFGREEDLIRVDMSEYMEKHSVSKIIGSPPGYVGFGEGGQLSEQIRRHPYSVILFDEIEKAHPDVFNILLQVLDDGHITDSNGRKVDFKNTVIIMTSNAGANRIIAPKYLGFSVDNTDKAKNHERMKKGVMEEVKQIFRPEFLNRIDETIVFAVLTKEEVKKIAKLFIDELKVRLLNEHQITLKITSSAMDLLADKGYDENYGARPLRRVIQNEIEDVLADKILEGTLSNGQTMTIGKKDKKLTFSVKETSK